jgi:hypothetical protein
MDIKPEDFPYYGLVIQQVPEEADLWRSTLRQGQSGTQDGQFHFAAMMHRLVIIADGQPLQGATPELRGKQLDSCLALFEDLGGRGHMPSIHIAAEAYRHRAHEAFMAKNARDLKANLEKMNFWLDKAEAGGMPHGPARAPKPATKPKSRLKPH